MRCVLDVERQLTQLMDLQSLEEIEFSEINEEMEYQQLKSEIHQVLPYLRDSIRIQQYPQLVLAMRVLQIIQESIGQYSILNDWGILNNLQEYIRIERNMIVSLFFISDKIHVTFSAILSRISNILKSLTNIVKEQTNYSLLLERDQQLLQKFTQKSSPKEQKEKTQNGNQTKKFQQGFDSDIERNDSYYQYMSKSLLQLTTIVKQILYKTKEYASDLLARGSLPPYNLNYKKSSSNIYIRHNVLKDISMNLENRQNTVNNPKSDLISEQIYEEYEQIQNIYNLTQSLLRIIGIVQPIPLNNFIIDQKFNYNDTLTYFIEQITNSIAFNSNNTMDYMHVLPPIGKKYISSLNYLYNEQQELLQSYLRPQKFQNVQHYHPQVSPKGNELEKFEFTSNSFTQNNKLIHIQSANEGDTTNDDSKCQTQKKIDDIQGEISKIRINKCVNDIQIDGSGEQNISNESRSRKGSELSRQKSHSYMVSQIQEAHEKDEYDTNFNHNYRRWTYAISSDKSRKKNKISRGQSLLVLHELSSIPPRLQETQISTQIIRESCERDNVKEEENEDHHHSVIDESNQNRQISIESNNNGSMLIKDELSYSSSQAKLQIEGKEVSEGVNDENESKEGVKKMRIQRFISSASESSSNGLDNESEGSDHQRNQASSLSRSFRKGSNEIQSEQHLKKGWKRFNNVGICTPNFHQQNSNYVSTNHPQPVGINTDDQDGYHFRTKKKSQFKKRVTISKKSNNLELQSDSEKDKEKRSFFNKIMHFFSKSDPSPTVIRNQSYQDENTEVFSQIPKAINLNDITFYKIKDVYNHENNIPRQSETNSQQFNSQLDLHRKQDYNENSTVRFFNYHDETIINHPQIQEEHDQLLQFEKQLSKLFENRSHQEVYDVQERKNNLLHIYGKRSKQLEIVKNQSLNYKELSFLVDQEIPGDDSNEQLNSEKKVIVYEASENKIKEDQFIQFPCESVNMFKFQLRERRKNQQVRINAQLNSYEYQVISQQMTKWNKLRIFVRKCLLLYRQNKERNKQLSDFFVIHSFHENNIMDEDIFDVNEYMRESRTQLINLSNQNKFICQNPFDYSCF